jgi:hypothetical protein
VTAGYSGTPLPRKLGIKPDSAVLVVSPPDGFVLEGGVPGGDRLDVIVDFCRDLDQLQATFEPLRQRLNPAGGLWIAWPKKASGVPTDLNDNVVREYGLAAGLVDNKVCAIDETWSGLRFVIRLAARSSL